MNLSKPIRLLIQVPIMLTLPPFAVLGLGLLARHPKLVFIAWVLRRTVATTPSS